MCCLDEDKVAIGVVYAVSDVSCQASSSQSLTRSGQARSGQVRSDQVRSDQIRSGQVRSDQIRSDQISLVVGQAVGQSVSRQISQPDKSLGLSLSRSVRAPHSCVIYTAACPLVLSLCYTHANLRRERHEPPARPRHTPRQTDKKTKKPLTTQRHPDTAS